MPDKSTVGDWLPPHQQHLLYTLAHADTLIENVGGVLLEYVAATPLGLDNRVREGREDVVVASMAPIPQSVPRQAADIINQLRAALEHALSAEVEHLMGRQLEPAEEQSIEMPVPKSDSGLSGWFRHKRRRSLPVLHADGVLGQRIAALQPPYGAEEDRIHPLRVLAEHSNLSKHRKPAEYALRLGRVIPDYWVPGLRITGEYPADRPLRIGDVLASVPAGTRVPLDIWPTVAIRRPHTREWIVLTHELRALESWVRTIALPTLITGNSEVDPIPPHLDISRGYTDYSEALSKAQIMPAAERLGLRLAGVGLREQLPAIFRQALPDTSHETVDNFVSRLSDAAAVEVLERYIRVRHGRGESNAVEYLRRLLR
ncbi:hypothetical protein V3C41_00275 [Paenarthrobacter nicotinovorans]|uniref:Uncharacterized protein n=1 Tax=Paenarthrobacter nicotinovorans TaxID=29320 RepID=A0ABV0GLV8_PAENI